MGDQNSTAAVAEKLLQTFQEMDPEACAALTRIKVPVSQGVKLPSEFICQTVRGKEHVTPLGLINSILAQVGSSKIATIVDDSGGVVGFTRQQIPPSPPPPPTAPAA